MTFFPIESYIFIERAADNGSPDLQDYGSNRAFIQNANINKLLVILSLVTSSCAFCVRPCLAQAELEGLQIDADYPGGNISVERIEGNRVHLRQELRDTKGWWFYWNFRVRGAAKRNLTFEFATPSPIGVRGPAVSTDRGITWTWLGADSVQGTSFSYAFGEHEEETRFCFAIPYVEEHLRRFLNARRDHPCLAVDELCKTRKGRSVERLLIGQPQAEPEYRVLLTARNHACESLASYAMEGFYRGDSGRYR